MPGYRGPGRCLGATAGSDADERAVRALADALETAPPAAVTWCRGWSERLGRAAGEPGRNALDGLWQEFAKQEPPDPAVGSAFRKLLAAVEDLTRRAGNPKNPQPELARERRAALLQRVACLVPES